MNDTADTVQSQHLHHIPKVRARLQKIAYWLDGCISIPGTRWKVGLEPIIGLVPVVGDIVGLALSSFIIIEGVRVGAPPQLTARMIGITLIDALSGLVPVVGDVFDFAFKANRRNAELLTRHLDSLEGKAPRRSLWLQILFLVLMAAILVLIGWGGFALFRYLF